MDEIDSKILAVMLRHCRDSSCDGCPGVANHCTGRVDMMGMASRHLTLRMAQIEGMTVRMYDAENARDALAARLERAERAGGELARVTEIVASCINGEGWRQDLDAALAAWRAAVPAKPPCATCGDSRWCDVELCPVDGSHGKRECGVSCEARKACPECGPALGKEKP